jgi:hypothetical protein
VTEQDPGPEAAGGEGAPALAPHHELAAQVMRLDAELRRHVSRLVEVEERVEEHAGALDALESAASELAASAHTLNGTGGADSPDARDPSRGESGKGAVGDPLPLRRLIEWVRANVADIIERRTPQTSGAPYWCRQWWRHPEAIVRFQAAHRCWHDAVSSPGSAMVIYLEHLDHQLAQLSAEHGPFSGCVGGTHRAPRRSGEAGGGLGMSGAGPAPLGQEDPPEEFFGDFERAHRDGLAAGAATRRS